MARCRHCGKILRFVESDYKQYHKEYHGGICEYCYQKYQKPKPKSRKEFTMAVVMTPIRQSC